MKKATTWIIVVTLLAFVIAWGVMGIKLLDGNYDITIEAYIGLISIIIFFVSVCIKRFSNSKIKCPHCGKLRWDEGKYCSYCGKEIQK